MQDEIAQRLARCFRQVFPELNSDQIHLAAQENIAGWDSIAHVTLLGLIGEEFGIEIDFEQFTEATSFAAIVELIRAQE